MATYDLGNVIGPQGPQGVAGPQGVKGDPGTPFKISKTYDSISAMQSDVSGEVEEGQMVIISTGNVEDEDNAKLYVKTSTGWQYIVDMSGATGIQGPQGEQGIQGQKGEQGIPGVDGAKGDTGADGKTPTMVLVTEDNHEQYAEYTVGHLLAIYED